ncbi:MAG TPA: hypothetical protein VD902_11715 [Symbiobacteriaceae bacterium]|nr:hypothetical protein [Symbiobacteriaceae bacterium]
MSEKTRPGAFYGAVIRGADQAARSAGDDRPSASPRHMERTMNIPTARQIPIEGAMTGPEAPTVEVDEIYSHADLDELGPLHES